MISLNIVMGRILVANGRISVRPVVEVCFGALVGRFPVREWRVARNRRGPISTHGTKRLADSIATFRRKSDGSDYLHSAAHL
jgi:hypothetical protein